eukprot:SM000034S12734  [mRNA]  locus=s34:482360:484600:- [translate_table: standard]
MAGCRDRAGAAVAGRQRRLSLLCLLAILGLRAWRLMGASPADPAHAWMDSKGQVFNSGEAHRLVCRPKAAALLEQLQDPAHQLAIQWVLSWRDRLTGHLADAILRRFREEHSNAAGVAAGPSLRPARKARRLLGDSGAALATAGGEATADLLGDRDPAMPPGAAAEEGGSATSADGALPAATAAALPTVVIFAGVEGSGHKFFEQVFRNLPVNFTVVQFEPELHLTALDSQFVSKEAKHKAAADSGCPKLPYARPLVEYVREMSLRLAAAGKGPYLRARDSYPMGRVRTPLARPDLVSFLELDGLLFKLKVVVIMRNLAAAVRSAFRAGYHSDDLGLQVRIVEDEMVYLDASVRMLPCGSYIVLDFDKVLERPELLAGGLAEFLELDLSVGDVESAVRTARSTQPRHHNDTMPLFGSQRLDDFFAFRRSMWPLLAAAEAAPYFYPLRPNDWPRIL